MNKPKRTIFSDRRDSDRRKQSLSMPAGMNRRSNGRRTRSFDPEPWWLRTDYAVELVIENKQYQGTDTNRDSNTKTTIDHN